jgi:hypothetical protein
MRPRSHSTPRLPGSRPAPAWHTGLLVVCAAGLISGCAAKSEEDAKSADEVDLGAPAPDLVLPDLSDVALEVAHAYGVTQEKPVEGADGVARTRTAVQRSTFLIDRSGIVRAALYGVGARGHAAEMLEKVKELQQQR